MKEKDFKMYTGLKRVCCDNCLEKVKSEIVVTKEDYQIMCCLVKGKSNKQIANDLSKLNKPERPVSKYQVENRLSKLYKLFEVNNRLNFVVKILTQDLLADFQMKPRKV